MFLDLYFREFMAAINFPCSKSGLRIGENDVIFSKIPHGLKFIITISIEVRIRTTKALAHKFVQFFYFNCYYNFNPCENDVIFSNSQLRLGTRNINGGHKFSERKVQNT